MTDQNKIVTAFSESDQTAFDIFDRSPSVYIDPGWFGFIKNGVVLRKLKDSPRATVSLSRIISNRFEFESVLISELSNPIVSEVYLANPERLRLLVWALGLLAYSEEVRHCVDGQKIRTLIGSIGQASYRFALLGLNEECSIPSAERCSLLLKEADLATIQNEKIIRAGLGVLAPFLLTQSVALNRRISLKLPVSWAHQIAFSFENIDAGQSRKLIELVLQDPSSFLAPVSSVGMVNGEIPLDTNSSSTSDVLPIKVNSV